MATALRTIFYYGKKIASHKFSYFVVFVIFLVHVSDSFSARLQEQPSAAQADRLEESPEMPDLVALETVSRKGADLTESVKADPDKEADRKISGMDIVTFALSLKGKPYKWAGVSPKTGFDCSGYIYFVFGEFGISLPHSSRAQYQDGIEIAENETRKGDLIFFRGTNPASKQVGHVGIVISEPGEPIRFVHSSTGRGVVEDDLARSYRRRYIGIKRIL